MNDKVIKVDVRRRHNTVTDDSRHRSRNSGPSGARRWGKAFSLCVMWVPVLCVLGVATELWFNFNPIGRWFFHVRYVKAVLYVVTWYLLMSTHLPRGVSVLLSGVFSFVGVGMVLAGEAVIKSWGLATFGIPWASFWIQTQWWYWSLLFVVYLYSVWRVGHGPRHWILKHGA